MNRNLQFAVGALMLCMPFITEGKGTHKKKATKEHFKLLEAYTQRVLPGIPGGSLPDAGYHFIIVWHGTSNLESCFWRGENGWLTCNIEKAHKISPKDARNFPPGMDYRTEPVTGDEVHKGDTISLTPIKGGKFAIPKEIPATAKNTLYYKSGGSKWLAFPVKTIGKKRDIAMQ